MADIICRVCGEPWDSTGGLHHSHADTDWWQYQQLVHGVGCPCCHGVYNTADVETLNNRFDVWESSIVHLSDQEVDIEELLYKPPFWLFTGIWDDDGEPNPRIIPLFFNNPEVEYPEDVPWRWVGDKPEPPHYGHAGDAKHCISMREQAKKAITYPGFPPGCVFVQREDSRAWSYGNAIPHAPYMDNHFAGLALVPRYRDENDEPTWLERIRLNDRAKLLGLEDQVWFGDKAPVEGYEDQLMVLIDGDHFDESEDADSVKLANYRAVMKELEDLKFGFYYSHGRLWVSVGHVKADKYVIDAEAPKWIYQLEAALGDYPCISDTAVSEVEAERTEKLIAEWVEEHAKDIGDSLGMDDEQAGRLLVAEADTVFADLELEPNGESWTKAPEVDGVVAKLVGQHCHQPWGWRVIATIAADVVYLVPKTPELDTLQPGGEIAGYMLGRDRDSDMGVVMRWCSNMAFSQLETNRFGDLKEVPWSNLSPDFCVAACRALADED